jgi:hypothetical protein
VPLPVVLRSSINLNTELYLSNRCVAPTLTMDGRQQLPEKGNRTVWSPSAGAVCRLSTTQGLALKSCLESEGLAKHPLTSSLHCYDLYPITCDERSRLHRHHNGVRRQMIGITASKPTSVPSPWQKSPGLHLRDYRKTTSSLAWNKFARCKTRPISRIPPGELKFHCWRTISRKGCPTWEDHLKTNSCVRKTSLSSKARKIGRSLCGLSKMSRIV